MPSREGPQTEGYVHFELPLRSAICKDPGLVPQEELLQMTTEDKEMGFRNPSVDVILPHRFLSNSQ